MQNLLAIVVIGVGALFVTVGLSGDYGGLFQAVGITLPGTETASSSGTDVGPGNLMTQHGGGLL